MLSVAVTAESETTGEGANRRLAIKTLPEPVLSSLRWPGRPELPEGNPAWTYLVESPYGRFALFVGHVEGEDGRNFPFEVWTNGAEQPRGVCAVAVLGRSRTGYLLRTRE